MTQLPVPRPDLTEFEPYYADGLVRLYLGDCREILPTLPGHSLIVTDPPYTTGIASTKREIGKTGSWGDLMNASTFYESFLRPARRLIALREGAAWVFTSWRTFPVLARASSSLDWPIASLLVWHKDWIGPGGPAALRPSYELVACFAEPGFRIADRSVPDVWTVPWSSQKPSGHPAEKPVPLLSRIIRESGGGRILDPFAGGGSTLVAAKGLGLEATGIEIEERYAEIAARRLIQEVLDFTPAGGLQREDRNG